MCDLILIAAVSPQLLWSLKFCGRSFSCEFPGNLHWCTMLNQIGFHDINQSFYNLFYILFILLSRIFRFKWLNSFFLCSGTLEFNYATLFIVRLAATNWSSGSGHASHSRAPCVACRWNPQEIAQVRYWIYGKFNCVESFCTMLLLDSSEFHLLICQQEELTSNELRLN